VFDVRKIWRRSGSTGVQEGKGDPRGGPWVKGGGTCGKINTSYHTSIIGDEKKKGGRTAGIKELSQSQDDGKSQGKRVHCKAYKNREIGFL